MISESNRWRRLEQDGGYDIVNRLLRHCLYRAAFATPECRVFSPSGATRAEAQCLLSATRRLKRRSSTALFRLPCDAACKFADENPGVCLVPVNNSTPLPQSHGAALPTKAPPPGQLCGTGRSASGVRSLCGSRRRWCGSRGACCFCRRHSGREHRRHCARPGEDRFQARSSASAIRRRSGRG